MKFAKVVFWIAGIGGFLVLTPLYFMFDVIGRQDPPPITHPGFYYSFVSVALAWQVAFLVIAQDPLRFRLMMIAAILEKFGYAISLTVLYLQSRLHSSDLVFGGADLLLGTLFLIAFQKPRPHHPWHSGSEPGLTISPVVSSRSYPRRFRER